MGSTAWELLLVKVLSFSKQSYNPNKGFRFSLKTGTTSPFPSTTDCLLLMLMMRALLVLLYCGKYQNCPEDSGNSQMFMTQTFSYMFSQKFKAKTH